MPAPLLLAAYTDALKDEPLGTGSILTEEAAHRLDRLLAALRAKLEQSHAVEEFTAATQSLAPLRLAADVLHGTTAQAHGGGAMAPANAQPWLLFGLLALKVVLYVTLVFGLLQSWQQLTMLAVIVLVILADVGSWMSIHFRQSQFAGAPPTATSHVAAEAVADGAQQAVAAMDHLVQRYSILMAEVRTLRQLQKAEPPPQLIPAGVAVTQRLLGAVRRQHPELAQLVEDEAETFLENETLKTQPHTECEAVDAFYDVQIDPHPRPTVELYPAIVHRTTGHVVLRGRLIRSA